MITRKQWSIFIDTMNDLNNKGFDLYINGTKVIKVEPLKDLIYTKLYTKVDGQYIRQRFTYDESINPYMTLKDLYGKVSLKVTMKDLYKGDLRKEFHVDEVLANSTVDNITPSVAVKTDRELDDLLISNYYSSGSSS